MPRPVNYENGLPGISLKPVNFRKKSDRVLYYTKLLLNKCQDMIQFDGLPDSVPERDLRRLLQLSGIALGLNPKITGGVPYFFYGGLGGEPDAYYNPTIATISSPALKFSGEYEIHKDVVVVRHDAWEQGLLPLIRPYATMAAEADLSLYIALITTRLPSVIAANDDRTYKSAEEFLKGLENGDLGLIYETKLLDALRVLPYSNTAAAQTITDLIEVSQYLKASLMNELGINANYNMKRESLSMTESQMNDDGLLPYIDGIIESIQTGLDEYNRLFGFNIRVRKGSAWKWRELEETEQHSEEPGTPGEPATEGGDGDAETT